MSSGLEQHPSRPTSSAIRRALIAAILGCVAAWACTFAAALAPPPGNPVSAAPTPEQRVWYDIELRRFDASLASRIALSDKVLHLRRFATHVVQLRGVPQGRARTSSRLFVDATHQRYGWPLPMAEHSCWRIQSGVSNRRDTVVIDGLVIPFLKRDGTGLPLAFVLPLRVDVAAMLVNTLVMAVIIACALFGPGCVRAQWRVRRGRCAACGYILMGTTVCSECGRPVAVSTPPG